MTDNGGAQGMDWDAYTNALDNLILYVEAGEGNWSAACKLCGTTYSSTDESVPAPIARRVERAQEMLRRMEQRK